MKRREAGVCGGVSGGHKRDINGFVINEKSSHERGRESAPSDQDR